MKRITTKKTIKRAKKSTMTGAMMAHVAEMRLKGWSLESLENWEGLNSVTVTMARQKTERKKSPEDNRSAATTFKQRQRDLGRKPPKIWATQAEHDVLKDALKVMRGDSSKFDSVVRRLRGGV